jgi:hypothetical protein
VADKPAGKPAGKPDKPFSPMLAGTYNGSQNVVRAKQKINTCTRVNT